MLMVVLYLIAYTAIIIAPIVIAVAAKLNLNQNHLLYAVMFGNFSFYTPMGY
jgi:di/tricarboxylate transporter